MIERNRRLPGSLARGVIFLFLLLSLSVSSSCTHGDRSKPYGSAPRYGLQKKVLLLPVLDLAEAGQETTLWIRLQVEDVIRGASGLILIKANEDRRAPPVPIPSLFPGFITDPGLIKMGEGLGADAMVVCVLNPLETKLTRKGFWPFRYTAREWEISLLLNVVEIYSRTLYASLLDSEKLYRPASGSPDPGHSPETLAQDMKEAIPAILKRQKSQLLKKLTDIRWSAVIASADGETLRIHGGQDEGIRLNQVFSVYGRGKEVQGKDGRSLTLHGKKVGEVRISEVSQTHSTAVIVSGGPFSAGQRIMDIR